MDDYLQEWFYGEEWKQITALAKYYANYRCIRCGKRKDPINLDTHHIIPISDFIESRYPEDGPVHYVFGIPTKKPWHCESNLEVLCMKCHGEIHPSLDKVYRRMDYHRRRDKNNH